MFNKRSYLLGLGSGIILGALLLELFYIGQNSHRSLNDIGKHEEQGIGQDEATGQNTQKLETSQPTVKAEASPSSHPSSSPNQQTQKQPASADQLAASSNQLLLIRIEPGFDLTQTAKLLKSNGIIHDSEPFINRMKTSNKLVRAGYFVFSEGTDVMEAITIVTGQPLSKEEAELRIAEQ